MTAVAAAAERAGMDPGAWAGQVLAAALRSQQTPSPGGPLDEAVLLELRGLRGELREQRRVLRNVGGNLNDVARHVNSTGQLHAATGRVLALVARAVTNNDACTARLRDAALVVLARHYASGS